MNDELLTKPQNENVGLKNRVAMFHNGRCGSQVLGDLLNQNPAMYWDGEIYEKMRRFNREAGRAEFSGDPIETLQSCMGGMSEESIYGFEVKFFHLRELSVKVKDYVANLKAVGFHDYILLKRRNTLRQLTSIFVGHQTAKWHLRPDEKPELTTITIDVDRVWGKKDSDLVTVLGQFNQRFDQLEKLLSYENILQLTYEDDIQDDPRHAYQRSCEFLNMSQDQEVSVNFRKSNPFPLSALIDNYVEVEAVLKNTSHEWMLYSS